MFRFLTYTHSFCHGHDRLSVAYYNNTSRTERLRGVKALHIATDGGKAVPAVIYLCLPLGAIGTIANLQRKHYSTNPV